MEKEARETGPATGGTPLPEPMGPQGAEAAASLAADTEHVGHGNPTEAALAQLSETLMLSKEGGLEFIPVSSEAAVPTASASAIPFATVSTIPVPSTSTTETSGSRPAPLGTLGDSDPQSIRQPSYPGSAIGSMPIDSMSLPEVTWKLNQVETIPVGSPVGDPAAVTLGTVDPHGTLGNAPGSSAVGIPIDQLIGTSNVGPQSSAVPANFCQGKFGYFADPNDKRCWVVCLFGQTPGCCPNNNCYVSLGQLIPGFCNILQVCAPSCSPHEFSWTRT